MCDIPPSGFDLHGPADPISPVVLSVPHAGRDYSAALVADARLPREALMHLEDRCVDVVAVAARRFETMLVARHPRAWIDLNRAEDERDPAIDAGASPNAVPGAKLRSGLGLVPRRAGAHGPIWRRRFSDGEIRARIEEVHRPYHDALKRLLNAACDRFGTAVLLDIHSMPPIRGERQAPQIVLGDRFGVTAGRNLIEAAEGAARQAGYTTTIIHPYSGGHIVQRHGSPASGIHAIQVEIDRSAYLDAAMRMPGPGTQRVATMLRTMIMELTDEATTAGAVAAQ